MMRAEAASSRREGPRGQQESKGAYRSAMGIPSLFSRGKASLEEHVLPHQVLGRMCGGDGAISTLPKACPFTLARLKL